MPTPTNPKLYEAVKKKIMKSYKKNSAFASGAIVKEYKRQGGKYKEDKEPKKLKRWFEEEWVNVNPLLGVDKDDAYPTFRPTKKVSKDTPTTLQEIDVKELKKQYALKQKYKGDKNLPEFKSKKETKKGKGLKSSTFKQLLESSYQGGDAAGFSMDRELSTKTSKVYTHPSGQVVVAHRGTSGVLDWGNNFAYGVGGELAYKLTSRYKEAKKVQQKAEKKYGAKNITTIGHSQGGLQAQLLGGNTKEIITLNKATRPQEMIFGSSKKKNQYDVRASGDAVSAFRNPFQVKGDETIKSAKNPLTQHKLEILENKEKVYGDKTFYGNGINACFVGNKLKDKKTFQKLIKEIVIQEHNKIMKKGGMIVKSFNDHPDNRGLEEVLNTFKGKGMKTQKEKYLLPPREEVKPPPQPLSPRRRFDRDLEYYKKNFFQVFVTNYAPRQNLETQKLYEYLRDYLYKLSNTRGIGILRKRNARKEIKILDDLMGFDTTEGLDLDDVSPVVFGTRI